MLNVRGLIASPAAGIDEFRGLTVGVRRIAEAASHNQNVANIVHRRCRVSGVVHRLEILLCFMKGPFGPAPLPSLFQHESEVIQLLTPPPSRSPASLNSNLACS